MSDGSISKQRAWQIAENEAIRNGIPLASYKHQKATFLQGCDYWCLTFEERGGLLAVGDQFAVFVESRSEKVRIVRGAGLMHVLTKQKLDAEIERLKAHQKP